MTFHAPFSRVITRPFGGVPSSAWWLSGGIAAANCIGAYQAKGAASKEASQVNLANSGTYDLAEVGTVTFDTSTGWQGGTGKYFTTDITAVAGEWSFIVRFTNASSNLGIPLGCSKADQRWYTVPNYVSASARVYIKSSETLISGAFPNGIICVSGLKAYEDGSFVKNLGGSSVTTEKLFILCANSGDGPDLPFGGQVQAIAIYNTALTVTQVGLLTTAMAAL